MSEKGSRLRTASWIMLTFVGSIVFFFSCASAYLAYSGADYPVGGEPVAEVAGGAGIEAALRGIRGTSAAYAAAFSALFLSIAAGPYRQGTKWSWWTLLGGYLLLAALVSLRVPTIGVRGSVGATLIPTALVVVALLMDVSRLRSASGS